MTTAESKFLDSIGVHNAEQDEVDLEYLKDVHWDRWLFFDDDPCPTGINQAT